jgi:hypothetical protein
VIEPGQVGTAKTRLSVAARSAQPVERCDWWNPVRSSVTSEVYRSLLALSDREC